MRRSTTPEPNKSRVGLLHPCGLCIAGDGAAGKSGNNRDAQAQGGEGGKDHAFHLTSPSIVGRDVRLR